MCMVGNLHRAIEIGRRLFTVNVNLPDTTSTYLSASCFHLFFQNLSFMHPFCLVAIIFYVLPILEPLGGMTCMLILH
jgi:hypothetical protein